MDVGNLTAFLIVRNEELLLPRCLASLAGVVDEIVVLDTGSTDGTRAALAAAAAAPAPPRLRWRDRPFDDFGSSRQAALDLVTTEWALWIDADELLSPALRTRVAALRTAAAGPDGLESHDAWEIPLQNRVLGRVMRGRNLAGQRRVRLFRRALGRVSPSLVHEGITLAAGARIGRLAEPIVHDTLTSWRRYLRKVELYTDLEAAADGRRLDPLHPLVTVPATLWREYVWRGGWRDGWPGLVWAATTAWSSLRRDVKRARRRRT